MQMDSAACTSFERALIRCSGVTCAYRSTSHLQLWWGGEWRGGGESHLPLVIQNKQQIQNNHRFKINNSVIVKMKKQNVNYFNPVIQWDHFKFLSLKCLHFIVNWDFIFKNFVTICAFVHQVIYIYKVFFDWLWRKMDKPGSTLLKVNIWKKSILFKPLTIL